MNASLHLTSPIVIVGMFGRSTSRNAGDDSIPIIGHTSERKTALEKLTHGIRWRGVQRLLPVLLRHLQVPCASMQITQCSVPEIRADEPSWLPATAARRGRLLAPSFARAVRTVDVVAMAVTSASAPQMPPTRTNDQANALGVPIGSPLCLLEYVRNVN